MKMPRKATTSAKTTAKRTAPKKTTKRTESPAEIIAEPKSSTEKKSFSVKRPNIKRSHIIAAVAILAVLGALYALKIVLIAATVNGQPITRLHLVRELEKQSGKEALNQLVTKKVIEQQANEKNIEVSQKEIDDEINKIKERVSQNGQSFDTLLAQQNMTMKDLQENIRIQKELEKLAAKNIAVSDKELNDYLQANQATPEGTEPTPPTQQQRVEAREALLEQKKNEAIQRWIQDVLSRANIDYPHEHLKPQQPLQQ